MDSTSLPPMPNPETGEPRPPAAPVESWVGDQAVRSEVSGRTAATPTGEGRVLENAPVPVKSAIVGGVIAALVCAAIVSLLHFDLSWVREWWMWVIVLVVAALFAGSRLGNRMAAGADWVSVGSKEWVNTYRLTKVKLSKYAGGYTLELADVEGRGLSVGLYAIQRQRAIWDLTYNGILHSVVDGHPQVNNLAVEKLQLPVANQS